MSQLPSNLADWLSYLEQLHPSTIELGLGRLKQVADKLGVPNFSIPVVTVAGTNGKGSTIATLEQIYSDAGYKVGCYTSPHMIRFNERIRLAGNEADDGLICATLARIEAARTNVEGGVSLTYFEFTTLAGLIILSEAELDVVLLEVGLGGRLDAINIADCDLAIVTTIALDHMDYLGHDLEGIAREKAGIMRAGKPALYGDMNPPKAIAEEAALVGAQLQMTGNDFSMQRQSDKSWLWQSGSESIAINQLQLPWQSISLALKASQLLQDCLPLQRDKLATSVAKASLTGRMQTVMQTPQVIVDVAHNPQAAENLQKQLAEQNCQGKTYAVIAMLSDKDRAGSLQFLLDSVDSWYVAGLDMPRGSSSQSMADLLSDLSVADISRCDTVAQAISQVLQQASPQDRVLIFGSFFTVSQAMQYFQQERLA
ncbi:bifunctional tetrahydrofolate synthase/dihydrofolate synthase [Pelagibaculum spongiae]|uniref:Dihydrofolate synthase/folylpolyglutamate synthase n=1 Tax=Pelagibaculum spongiae TaxID=2080658 RepID=A0A2V1H3D5_9GAMM|nr:bifunctional tetrahydrofolate synthase/dihydrofolate synthase [Pelagibaculum spongiae]PVZ71687.1 bifunctional tetrahydrofolate synthase/dihydrofolate synthase [Pelagibaculum spongiae]